MKPVAAKFTFTALLFLTQSVMGNTTHAETRPTADFGFALCESVTFTRNDRLRCDQAIRQKMTATPSFINMAITACEENNHGVGAARAGRAVECFKQAAELSADPALLKASDICSLKGGSYPRQHSCLRSEIAVALNEELLTLLSAKRELLKKQRPQAPAVSPNTRKQLADPVANSSNEIRNSASSPAR
ncbi:MAG: hypothetical protein NDJ89_16895 [Oligoflexia bacterium]|nr:hypothetical protein [Oligoflexia bacterium]